MSNFNQNQQHGARTGQHFGPRQQGEIFRTRWIDKPAPEELTDIETYQQCGDAALDLILRYQPAPTRVEASWPSTPADVQGACTMFAFADRIEIDLAQRCEICGTVYTTDECPDCPLYDLADGDLAGDEAYETWRDRQ